MKSTYSSTNRIYELSVEVKPMAGSAMPPDMLGAFVFCYVPAENMEESIGILKSALSEDRYELLEIEYCAKIDLSTWAPENEQFPTAEQLGSLDFGELLYSPFYGYQSRYEH